MLKNILTFIIINLLFLDVSAQSFQISHVYAQYYSYDKYTNDVYYADLYLTTLYVKNLSTSEIRSCPFPTLPSFAHNSHKCVYGDQDSIFIYDFNLNKTLKIASSIDYGVLGYTFSPDDDYLLFGDYYYSFSDSTIHNSIVPPSPDLEYEWMNDTVFVFLSDNIIYSYNFISEELDSLLVSSDQMPISGFSYNRHKNLLYYSFDSNEYPQIHSYDPLTQIDLIIFDASNHPDYCWPGPSHFHCMEWSPDNKRMAFFSTIIDGGDTIYDMDPDSGIVHRYTECGGDGYLYLVSWLNNDTIIFYNATLINIYGFILDHPLEVEEVPIHMVPGAFSVSSYPNPFNSSVTINLKGIIKNPEIRIYNINGEEIKRFENLQSPVYQYNQVWNGKNNSGGDVSSGVYFVIVTEKSNPILIKGISKIIYLK